MPVSAGFIETIKELAGPLGRITVRRMFGGAGVYCDGQVFALLDDDVLYLKVDETSRPAFLAEGCGPFTYRTRDGMHALASYHRAPDRLLDEPDEMAAWCRRALDIGRRAAAAKSASKSAKHPPRGPRRRAGGRQPLSKVAT
jgi:DNA transformation protein